MPRHPNFLIISIFVLLLFILAIASVSKPEAKKINSPDANEQAQLSALNCKNAGAGGKLSCYASEMESISYNHGPEFSFKVLSALQEIDKESEACHFIAHGIGWGSYKQNSSDWQNLIAKSSPVCSYGAQMGIIELYTQSLPDGTLKKEDVPNLCGQNPRADCNHAVGHMMLLEADGDLGNAFELCSGITDKNQNFMCLTGVFMERIIASNLIEHGIVPKNWSNWPSRLPLDEQLCNSFNGTYSVACWREIAHAAYHYYNKDPQSIFDFCSRAPSYPAARNCKEHSLPELMAPKRYSLPLLKEVCAIESKRDPGFEKNCYLTIVGIKLNFVKPEKAIDAADYCASLGAEMQKACFSRIGSALKTRSASTHEIDKLCSKSGFPALNEACMMSAGVRKNASQHLPNKPG